MQPITPRTRFRPRSSVVRPRSAGSARLVRFSTTGIDEGQPEIDQANQDHLVGEGHLCRIQRPFPHQCDEQAVSDPGEQLSPHEDHDDRRDRRRTPGHSARRRPRQDRLTVEEPNCDHRPRADDPDQDHREVDREEDGRLIRRIRGHGRVSSRWRDRGSCDFMVTARGRAIHLAAWMACALESAVAMVVSTAAGGRSSHAERR